MSHSSSRIDAEHLGTLKTYVVGYSLSLILTLLAYFLVVKHPLSPTTIVVAIVVLAVIQMFVQMILFLHLGTEPKPYWNLTVFLFMVLVLVVVVFGSLWIMYNLNYHMSSDMNMHQEGI